MNKSESKYYNTACLMDEALIELLDKKEFEFITVKEICVKAGVNRSTFYLHYETMGDLLEECAQYVLKNFYDHMKPVDSGVINRITDAPLEELIFVTPEYLKPYLDYIKSNKRLYITLMNNVGLFGWQNTYEQMFIKIFDPIMSRFGFPSDERAYTVMFYINGIMAVVKEWLKKDCVDDADKIISIICKNIKNYTD